MRDGSRGIRLYFTFEGRRYFKTIHINGKPLLANARNEKYARRLAEEIDAKIRAGNFVLTEYFPASNRDTGSALTVGDQLDAWLATQRIEHSTKAGYSSALRFWKAAPYDAKAPAEKLGDLPLRALKLSHILTAIASRPNLSGKTINNYLSVLRPALDLAVSDKVLVENSALEVPEATHQRVPPDPFTLEEAERIIANMAKHYPGRVEDWRADIRLRWLLHRFRDGPQSGCHRHVSSPRLVERNGRFSRIALSCVLLLKGYETYQAGDAFGRGCRRTR